MPNVFSLLRSHCVDLTDPALHAEIRAQTGGETAVEPILRSIERFGIDPSIARFEVTPKKAGLGRRTTQSVSWSVRAVRGSE